MVSFQKDSIDLFFILKGKYNGQRIGQKFFDYFECHKVVEPESRNFLDKIYEKDDIEAIKMINSITVY